MADVMHRYVWRCEFAMAEWLSRFLRERAEVEFCAENAIIMECLQEGPAYIKLQLVRVTVLVTQGQYGENILSICIGRAWITWRWTDLSRCAARVPKLIEPSLTSIATHSSASMHSYSYAQRRRTMSGQVRSWKDSSIRPHYITSTRSSTRRMPSPRNVSHS